MAEERAVPHGRPVVLAAPSGAGKTTIARRLVGDDPRFVFSTSVTTRAPRPGEAHGVDYVFTDEADFVRLVESGELAEWARVHGRMYGTPVKNLEQAAARGEYPLLDIDVQGARQIRERVPEALLIFVLPPSLERWIDRLRGRGTEGTGELALRLRTAVDELEAVSEFDVVVLNDDLDETVAEVRRLARDGGAGLGSDEVRRRVAALRDGVARALNDLAVPGRTQAVRGSADAGH